MSRRFENERKGSGISEKTKKDNRKRDYMKKDASKKEDAGKAFLKKDNRNTENSYKKNPKTENLKAGNRKTGSPKTKNPKAENSKAEEQKKDLRKSASTGMTQNNSRNNNGKSACPVQEKCGGCSYREGMYAQSLSEKQRMMQQLLGNICPVHPITGMENPCHYRNKVTAAFQYNKGTIVSGIYQEGSHRVVNVDSCKIEDKTADAIIVSIRGLLKSFKIRVYDEDTQFGLLRHVQIRRGFTSGEVMVVLVVSSPVFPSKNNFVKALRELHPEISTVVLNINDKNTSMVLGERNITLYGKGYITDTLCGRTFRISPNSFYQINPVQTEKLYAKAIELAGLTGKERVIDAYCGIGTIGMAASGSAGEVIGVELNKDAVKDAIANAKENKVTNIHFVQGDAGDFMVSMAEQGEHADVVLMDPPRSGSTEAFMGAVAKLGPSRVVYVSCGPDTLARDLKVFKRLGYKAVEAWPFDMFCWTEHCETVVLLSKGEISSRRVRVDFSLENLDTTFLRGEATYEQIKAYVLEQTGLKVSTLYISQIKRKCGLEVGESYNKPKNEASKVPVCPQEKEVAIMDALQHFEII